MSGNRIHDGKDHRIVVLASACPQIEENEIWGNPMGKAPRGLCNPGVYGVF